MKRFIERIILLGQKSPLGILHRAEIVFDKFGKVAGRLNRIQRTICGIRASIANSRGGI